MKQIQLSLLALTALGFNQQLTENDGPTLSAAIEKLSAELKAEKEAHAALKTKHAELAASQGKAMIDEAITAGKITEADREEYSQLAATNYSLAAKMLSKLPGKTTLGAQVNNPATGGVGPKDLDEFQKLSVSEQLAFKANQPEAYKKLLA